MFAFTPSSPLPITPHPISARCPLRHAARRPTPTPPTHPCNRSRRRTPPTMRRSGRGANRAPPVDDAFATCPSCGSDEPVAAADLLRHGSTKARCSQCGNRWTATAADALTDSGASLVDIHVQRQRAQQQEQQGGQQLQQGGAAAGASQEPYNASADIGVRLYVSGLGAKVDSEKLRSILEAYGEVRDAKVVFDRETGRSRGFGFVTVVGRSAASAAIDDLSGSTVLGRRLSVREAIS